MAAFSLTIADHAIKALVSASKGSLPLQLIPETLSITYARNTGIAFGVLQGSNLFLGIISMAVAAMIILYHKKLKRGLESAAVVLVLGGTLSNLIDRLFRGAVIDYLALRGIPTFNLADAALTAGAALIITSYVIDKFKRKPNSCRSGLAKPVKRL